MEAALINTNSNSNSLPMMLFVFFKDIYGYREYLKQSVVRDLKRRYKRSVLGYLWSMLNPLLMMIILAVVFSKIMQQNVKDYAVFLYSGSIPWTYFNATILLCLCTIRANINIMTQVNVPSYIFPLAVGFSGIVDMIFSFIPLLLVMLFLGHEISYHILALPILLIPMFFATMGISLLLAVSNVFFEDTEHLVNVALRALYFLCPIMYTREMLPDWLIKYVVINPMFSIIEFSQDLFFYNRFPDPKAYSYVFLGSFFCLALGVYVFNKAQKKFMYYV